MPIVAPPPRAAYELMLAHFGAPDTERLVEDCNRHVEHALALDPDLAIGLSTRGTARLFFERDLDAAVHERSRSLPFLWVTPAFESLHGDPRFQALGQRLGLPSSGSAGGEVCQAAPRSR